jgi:transcriptional regulator with GAF, ATPase, and Fis domain
VLFAQLIRAARLFSEVIQTQVSGPPVVNEVLDQLIGKAPAFQDVVSRLPALAQTDRVVLISGETGTGKELVARAIHDLGPHASRPT